MVKNTLQSLEYQVVCASDAASARRLLDERPDISLILSDIALPGGISGPQFVGQARKKLPEIKAIFMSGYPDLVMNGSATLQGDDPFLRKPFKISELARVMRNELDSNPAP